MSIIRFMDKATRNPFRCEDPCFMKRKAQIRVDGASQQESSVIYYFQRHNNRLSYSLPLVILLSSTPTPISFYRVSRIGPLRPRSRVLSTVSNHRHCYRSNTSLSPSLCVNRWNCSGSFLCFALELQDWLYVLFSPFRLIPHPIFNLTCFLRHSLTNSRNISSCHCVISRFKPIYLYSAVRFRCYDPLSVPSPAIFFYVCVYIYRCTALFTKNPIIHYIPRSLIGMSSFSLCFFLDLEDSVDLPFLKHFSVLIFVFFKYITPWPHKLLTSSSIFPNSFEIVFFKQDK